MDHIADHHIEEGGQRKPPLGSVAGRPELGYTITVLLCDHLLVLSEIRQDSLHFWACPIPLQGLQ